MATPPPTNVLLSQHPYAKPLLPSPKVLQPCSLVFQLFQLGSACGHSANHALWHPYNVREALDTQAGGGELLGQGQKQLEAEPVTTMGRASVHGFTASSLPTEIFRVPKSLPLDLTRLRGKANCWGRGGEQSWGHSCKFTFFLRVGDKR